jgi:hypothetical protein
MGVFDELPERVNTEDRVSEASGMGSHGDR